MVFRSVVLLAMIFLVTACAKKEEPFATDLQVNERDTITAGPLDGAEVYPGQALDGPAPGTQQDLVVNVGDRVFFGYDRSDLTPEAQRTLELQADWLQRYPNINVTIAGHADERGTREYNLALGERRANSVRNYLIALGVASSRITTISYGKERPAVLGSNPAAWAQNRRAVTEVN